MIGIGALGQYPLGGGPSGTATVTNIAWFANFSEPVRFRRAPRAAVAVNNQTFAFSPLPVVSFGWMQELSKPRSLEKRGLAAARQQFAAYQANPTTVTPFAWFAPLTEPVRIKRALKTGLQQAFAYQANPTTVTPFAWFAPLSLPVRVKPGLKPGLQQFYTADTAAIPVSRLVQWMTPFGLPVWPKKGLRKELQPVLAWPPQLRPTPATSGVMNALETPDVFLGGATVWNAVQSGEIGVIEKKHIDEVSIVVNGGRPAIARAAVAITII
jgi:hypothetical protein